MGELKKAIRPDEDPNSWQHHFTEIWGAPPCGTDVVGGCLPGVFHLKNKDAKIAHARRLANMVREAQPDLIFFNVSSCIRVPEDKKARREAIKYQKQETFCRAVMSTLDTFRQQKKSVNWVFDNVKDTTSGERTEGWAAECFLGLQYTRLFTWISAGAAVVQPKFVPPGSHCLLEIADFVSYCVARDFEKAVCGEKSELPSGLLGRGIYEAVLANGDVEVMPATGLPLGNLYGLA